MSRPSFTKVVIHSADSVNRRQLSIDALDSRSREIAVRTLIAHAGQLLSCRSYKVLPNGNLQLEITADSWSFFNANEEEVDEKNM